jgi:hypothetical protein
MYAHRYADIILNSDYELKKEIEAIIKSISYKDILQEYEKENVSRKDLGKREAQGRQSVINTKFREHFLNRGWIAEKNVFTVDKKEPDLKLDFWKREVGVDVAFNHRSFIGGDLLRLQAAAEVTGIIKVGVYVCAMKEFIKTISRDGNSLVHFERTEWYLKNFYPVLTVPILLIGLSE